MRCLPKNPLRALALSACVAFAALQLAGCSSREQRAQNYYERGADYLKKNDYVKARIEIQNALQLNRNLVPALRALAQIEEHNREYRPLAGVLRRVVELDPKDIDSQNKLGRLFLLGGNFDEALKRANAVTDIDPKNITGLALKAAVLLKLQDMDGALRTAQEALAIDPESTEANVALASIEFTKGNTSNALKALDHVKKDNQDDLGVDLLRISIFNKMGSLDKVEGLLRRLVDLYPKQPSFRTELIRFYLAHNRGDDAIKELRTFADANADDVNVQLELINLINIVKGVDAARAELVNRIGNDKNAFSLRIALAKLDFARGNSTESTKLLQQLISTSKSANDVATARATLAEMYMSKNDSASAEPLVKAILTADSNNTDGLLLEATILLNREKNDDAIADLRRALNNQPRSPILLETLGTAYERGGLIELADKAFLDATKASNYTPAVGLNYIAFLRRRGSEQQADNVLADLASRNPNSVPILSNLAQVKLAHQDWAGAHALADAIHRLDDKNVLADQINGAAFSGEKRFTDSLSVLQAAYAANPAVQPMAALVNAYVQSKQTDKAQEFLQSALKANPQNAEALVLLGSLHLLNNHPDEAVKNFNAAIKAQPKDPAGYRALAFVFARDKKFDNAIATLKTGIEQQPTSFALHLELASILETKGDYEGAISEYEVMLKQNPGSMIVANNLASLLTDHRTDKASLDRANTLGRMLAKSQIPQFKDTLGWIDYRRDNYPSAVSLLEDAKQALPNNPLVHYHLGMSYLATGQDAKANEQFEKARALAPKDSDLLTKIDAALKNHAEKTKG